LIADCQLPIGDWPRLSRLDSPETHLQRAD
jgi:hypothetical protein